MDRLTTRQISKMKNDGKKICMLTCYDATFARLLDNAGVNILFIGDSLGMVIKGENTTLNVTIEEVAYHTRAVSSQAKQAHVLADMPFMSYQASDDEMLKNAALLLRAGAQSIKLEGGEWLRDKVKKLVQAGIPVMGHIGLTPQSVNTQGLAVQGRGERAKEELLRDALAIQEAGAYALVLECVPADVAKEITNALTIPTIGIGASAACDGQVLVLYDLLRFNPEFSPKFLKHFAQGDSLVTQACKSYITEVREGRFPTIQHSYE